MKKSHLILAAVPMVCALGGFGSGYLLRDGAQAAGHTLPAPTTAAEGVLRTLADQEGPSHPASHVVEEKPEQHSALETGERLYHAGFVIGDNDRSMGAPDIRRLDTAKIETYAKTVATEKRRAEKRAELEAKMAELEAEADKGTSHPALLPVDVEARIAEDAIKRVAASDDHVVKLGRITLPVEGAAKTTYYVADFGIAVTDLDKASYFYEGENAARVRDRVMTALFTMSTTQLMRSDRVDSQKLADHLTQDLQQDFAGIEDFIFLSLYKTDVPRS